MTGVVLKAWVIFAQRGSTAIQMYRACFWLPGTPNPQLGKPAKAHAVNGSTDMNFTRHEARCPKY